MRGAAASLPARLRTAPTTIAVTPTQACYVRLVVTAGWYPTEPGYNTQLAEFAIYAGPDNPEN
jgi:hypothetical protein